MPRFLARPGDIAAGRIRFGPAEAHHLARVRRLRPGALVEVTDGAGAVYTVRLEVVAPGEAEGTVLGAGGAPRESPCAITLAAGLLKGDRMDWLIQKVTELGVARIVPMTTARTVVRPGEGRGAGRRTRWARIAAEATKQCGRARTPAVEPVAPLAAVLDLAAAHDRAWLCWEGEAPALGRAVAAAGRPERVLLLVGPEGGLTSEEVALARHAGVAPVGLGPRILRAESAAVVAVALCQHRLGDLGPG